MIRKQNYLHVWNNFVHASYENSSQYNADATFKILYISSVYYIEKTEQHLEWSKCENVVFSFWYPLPKHKAYTNFTNNLLCNQFLRKEKISNIYLQYAVLLVKTYYHNYTIRYLILVFRFEVLWVFLYFVILIFNVQCKIWN